MKAHVIIQARCGSSRLPGKVLLPLVGVTVMEHVVKRAQKANFIDKVILATTTKEEDQQLVNLAEKLGISVYCGSESDVLDRYYQAAKQYKVNHIVRITSDCPVIDPQVVDKVVHTYFKEKVDYCSNTLTESYPDGEDVETFSFAALEKAWQEAKLPSEREHVTPYIKKHSEMFKLYAVSNGENLGDHRWTLDREEDYKFLEILFEEFYPKNPYFGMPEILEFINQNPQIKEINKHIPPNEGYLKSLQEDRKFIEGR